MTAAPRKIFLVEDDEHIRMLVETLLKGAGYTILSTTEPQQAHDIARREMPDLVLCDIAMPVLDGYGVLRELQADPDTARIPVVFLTAHREFSERVRAFRFGVVDYVTKPFTRDILLKKIEKVLEGLHHRPGFEGGTGEASVQTLVDEVKREGRSGVLTVTNPKGEQRAVFRGGELVEGALPPVSRASKGALPGAGPRPRGHRGPRPAPAARERVRPRGAAGAARGACARCWWSTTTRSSAPS